MKIEKKFQAIEQLPLHSVKVLVWCAVSMLHVVHFKASECVAKLVYVL
jgi:hypothetical protein